MKTRYGAEYEKTIHITGKMADPVRQSDGSWKVISRDYEEDIPDLGREELICNQCGWPSYPKCKREWCKAWVQHTKKN